MMTLMMVMMMKVKMVDRIFPSAEAQQQRQMNCPHSNFVWKTVNLCLVVTLLYLINAPVSLSAMNLVKYSETQRGTNLLPH